MKDLLTTSIVSAISDGLDRDIYTLQSALNILRRAKQDIDNLIEVPEATQHFEQVRVPVKAKVSTKPLSAAINDFLDSHMKSGKKFTREDIKNYVRKYVPNFNRGSFDTSLYQWNKKNNTKFEDIGDGYLVLASKDQE